MEQRFTSPTVQRIWEINGCPLKRDISGKPLDNYMWTIGDCGDTFGMTKVPKPITNDAWDTVTLEDGIDYMDDDESSKNMIQKLIRKNWTQSTTRFHKRPTDIQMKLMKAAGNHYSTPIKKKPKKFNDKFVVIGRKM